MKPRPPRVTFTALAAFLFLVAAFDPTPSQPSISTAGRHAPDPGELLTAEWIAGRTGGDLAVLRPRDLDAAMASKRHGFELFPRSDTPDPLAERSFLAKLPYGRAMWRAAERNRLDGLLLAAVVETESSFSPKAVSPDGAIGLMQVIPETAALYGKKTDLFDPTVNLDVGCQYLASLIDRYHGDLALAVAAYNAGPAAVTRYRGVPPYPETRDYVKSVLSRYVDHQQTLAKAEAGRLLDGKLTTRERVARAGHSLFDPAPQSPAGGERAAVLAR